MTSHRTESAEARAKRERHKQARMVRDDFDIQAEGCERCEGSGWDPHKTNVACTACHGGKQFIHYKLRHQS